MSEVEKQAEKPAEVSSAVPETGEQGENQQQPAVEQVEQQPQDEERERKRHGLSKRFSELTQARREAEERAARAEKELEEIRNRQKAPADGDKDSKPVLDKFATYDEYIEALSNWKAREVVKEATREQLETRQQAIEQSKQAALQAEYKAKADVARDKYADFDAVAFREDVAVSKPMMDAIMYSEHGADLQYWFGKNPDQAARIAMLSPPEALLAIGRLEAQIASQPAVKTTSAPAPISPVQARAQAQKTPDEMTDEEYIAWRTAQKRAAKRF